MEITLTIGWWWIPLAITLIALAAALLPDYDGGGYMSGIGNLFALVPALAVSCLTWIVAAVLK